MIIDLFAGPGGWSEGLRMLSPEMHATEVGLEWDELACLTRAAAGHRTVRTDIAAYPTEPFSGVVGLIASPPCQDFSSAGRKVGITGERGQLVHEVIRWAEALRPEWVACEQVPVVLPIWKRYAQNLRGLGYSTWAGLLNAADYGIPQTRRRAFLLASRVRDVIAPEPTHAESPAPVLFGNNRASWVTMSDALRDEINPENWVINTGCTFAEKGNRDSALIFDGSRVPSWTITGQVGSQWQIARAGDTGTKLTTGAALILQSFPPDYPVSGSMSQQFLQIGNAIPPVLAAHVLSAVTGVSYRPR